MKVVVFDPEAFTYQRLLSGEPGVEIIPAPAYDDALAVIADADALMALAPYIPNELVARASKLRWIQALTTGVDTFDRMPALRPEVVVTSGRGIHGPQVAEMALLQMLALARNFPKMIENQRLQRWERWPQSLLSRRTVCIVGVGVIGEALAKRCAACEMKVIGVSSAVRDLEHFDQVFSRDDLPKALAKSDFVVLLTPYTKETHHLIDQGALESMRPGAYLINLSRGGVVDEAALLTALQANRIAGASIDVFEQEPLPEDNPFWRLPNVIVTSHMGGFSDTYPEQLLPIIQHNIRAVLEQRLGDLKNRVWPARASGPNGNRP